MAASGADAAPYFRIYNPIEQDRKFDPEGAYVRHWCTEPARLPTSAIHAPFEVPAVALAAAGFELGRTDPFAIVNHTEARRAALAGYEAVKRASAE